MDCFLDFCLACDKQTMEGLYCSQACRLADLEKAGSSAPPSPSDLGSSEQSGWPFKSNGFTLPPGIDFGASKSSFHSQMEIKLSPSTSRSSLSSSASTSSTQTTNPVAMSEQTQHELDGYVSAFDAVREWKRRSLSSISGH